MGNCFKIIITCLKRDKPSDKDDSGLQKKNDDYNTADRNKKDSLEKRVENEKHVIHRDAQTNLHTNNYSIEINQLENPLKNKKKVRSHKDLNQIKKLKEQDNESVGSEKCMVSSDIIEEKTEVESYNDLIRPKCMVSSDIIEEKIEVESFNDLMRPKCMHCKMRKDKVIGFLCNHNACEDCAVMHCAKLIVQFYYSYSENKGSHIEFFYSCPVANCDKKISFPTLLVLKRVRRLLEDAEFRKTHQDLEVLEQEIVDLWIPYFDGLVSSYLT